MATTSSSAVRCQVAW